jgi:hypothetical protein
LKRKTLPGGRTKEGDLLFWEGVFLLMRARQFCMKSWMEFAKYRRLFSGISISEVQQRFETFYAIANMMNYFLGSNLLGRSPNVRFAEQMAHIDQIEQNWPRDQRDAMLKEEKIARGIVRELYRFGWEGIVKDARERLHLAEAIYRRLGNQQGISATTFAQAYLGFQFSPPAAFGERPSWIDQFERFYRWSAGELGYHLDALRAHIIVAQWASEHDLYQSVTEFRAADTLVMPERLKLLKVLSGETSYQIGTLIGNMESAPFSTDSIFKSFENAATVFDGLEDDLPYIEQHEMTDRRLTIHWWLAELSRRQAYSENDPVVQERYLHRVISECNYVINRSKGVEAYARNENLARLVRGSALVDSGKLLEGIAETELAYAYFKSTKDLYDLLQCLTHLVEWGIRKKSDDPKWTDYFKRVQQDYIRELHDLAGLRWPTVLFDSHRKASTPSRNILAGTGPSSWIQRTQGGATMVQHYIRYS